MGNVSVPLCLRGPWRPFYAGGAAVFLGGLKNGVVTTVAPTY